MRPSRRSVWVGLLVAVLALAAAPAALAAAGGGSAGFSGGGGGGGGGSGFAIYILIQLLVRIALLGHGVGALVLLGLAIAWFLVTRVAPRAHSGFATRTASRRGAGTRRRRSERERRVQAAAAVAAEEDPAFAPDAVRAAATQLFADVQAAWTRDDRQALGRLVGPRLLAEWERRLDDFSRRGWRNHVEPLGEPVVEYVGLTHTGVQDTDRVVVRIDARVRDYVADPYGRQLKRTGALSEVSHLREFWTLQRRNGRWILASIEQKGEGAHALQERPVATASDDEGALRDQAMVEGAVADAVPEGTSVAEVADLQFDGTAHAAANDLSLADGRFAPDVLQIAARRAADAWAQAVDGQDSLLRRVASPEAVPKLLYGGDASGRTRVVVRGPHVNRIRVVGLDPGAQPPTMTVEVDITARRYVEDRDTTAVLVGSKSRPTGFTERWTFTLTDDAEQPWRVTGARAPTGLS